MKTKSKPTDNALTPAEKHLIAVDKTNDDASGVVLDEHTTYDVIVSPVGDILELSDTVDAMDGATTEVIDIVSESDGTNIEVTIIEEPSDKPGIDSVDRFIEIKGIGPKVAELLMQAGIKQFSKLAETPVERIREILSAAGTHYRIYDPTDWPQQAKQLADSKPLPSNYPTPNDSEQVKGVSYVKV